MLLPGLLLMLAAVPGDRHPDCANAMPQIVLNQCAGAHAMRADAALNAQWARTSAAVTPENRTALLIAQRAWLRFRDTECVSEGAAYTGGSLRPTIVSECRAALTEARTKQLAELDTGN